MKFSDHPLLHAPVAMTTCGDGVQAQGQLLSRRGHDFILYRYGRDLFFRVDHLELALCPGMSGHHIQKGRFSAWVT